MSGRMCVHVRVVVHIDVHVHVRMFTSIFHVRHDNIAWVNAYVVGVVHVCVCV